MVTRPTIPELSEKQILEALQGTETSLDAELPNTKLLLYGNPGVGKTVLSFQIAHAILSPGKRIYYIDSAENWVSLQNHPELKKRAARFRYEGISQIEALLRAFESELPPYNDCGVLIIDEHTTISDKILDIVVQQQDIKNKKDKDGNERVGDHAEWGDRDIHTRIMERLHQKLFKADVNLILLGHERFEERPKKTPEICVNMPAAARTSLVRVVHTMLRMTAEQKGVTSEYKRTLQCHPAKLVSVKARVGGLDVYTEPQKFIETLKKWRLGEIPNSNGEINIGENPAEDFGGIEV